MLHLITADGTVTASYTYNPYGTVLTSTGNMAAVNPLRYRGYYYDSETSFYYLKSRYYDPEIGRFINADSYVSTGQGVLGNNMFTYCLNNPVCMVDSLGTEPTEAVDVDGDGEPDYYRYDYSYTCIVYLRYHDYSFETTISGSVYIFPETNESFFENEDNIPKDFNSFTDLLVADVPGVENITFYAYQAQYVMYGSRDEIVEILRQYDADFVRGFNRSTESLLAEWKYHMLLGGKMGISRSANVDFDRDAENKGLGFYIMKAILGVLGIP